MCLDHVSSKSILETLSEFHGLNIWMKQQLPYRGGSFNITFLVGVGKPSRQV